MRVSSKAADALARVILDSQEEDRLRYIIIDLFAPEHFDGCLFRDDSRMPCQCGYHDRRARYFKAKEAAEKIAAEHDYLNDPRT